MAAEVLDAEAVEVLRRALKSGQEDVAALLRRAVAVAQGEPNTLGASDVPPEWAERRLGDRVLWALELAVTQEDLETALHLDHAFEAAMTRFGGANKVEKRDVPAAMAGIYARLDELRQRHQK